MNLTEVGDGIIRLEKQPKPLLFGPGGNSSRCQPARNDPIHLPAKPQLEELSKKRDALPPEHRNLVNAALFQLRRAELAD